MFWLVVVSVDRNFTTYPVR